MYVFIYSFYLHIHACERMFMHTFTCGKFLPDIKQYRSHCLKLTISNEKSTQINHIFKYSNHNFLQILYSKSTYISHRVYRISEYRWKKGSRDLHSCDHLGGIWSNYNKQSLPGQNYGLGKHLEQKPALP